MGAANRPAPQRLAAFTPALTSHANTEAAQNRTAQRRRRNFTPRCATDYILHKHIVTYVTPSLVRTVSHPATHAPKMARTRARALSTEAARSRGAQRHHRDHFAVSRYVFDDNLAHFGTVHLHFFDDKCTLCHLQIHTLATSTVGTLKHCLKALRLDTHSHKGRHPQCHIRSYLLRLGKQLRAKGLPPPPPSSL